MGLMNQMVGKIKTDDLDITSKDIASLKELIKKYPDDEDSPLINMAKILLKLARKSF